MIENENQNENNENNENEAAEELVFKDHETAHVAATEAFCALLREDISDLEKDAKGDFTFRCFGESFRVFPTPKRDKYGFANGSYAWQDASKQCGRLYLPGESGEYLEKLFEKQQLNNAFTLLAKMEARKNNAKF